MAGSVVRTEELSETVRADLQLAKGLAAQAVQSPSWSRNTSWLLKFRDYIRQHCKNQLLTVGERRTLMSVTIATAFLANVVREKPTAPTRITSAKRAINLLRAIAKHAPLDDSVMIRYMARGARNSTVRTKRQAQALLAMYIAMIIRKWGRSTIWWKRMVALMILVSFCAITRGAGTVSCLRRGVAWVRKDGSQPKNPTAFTPQQSCNAAICSHHSCVRGFLLLLPFRKNRRNSPSWIPIAEKNAVAMMARHLRWVNQLPPGHYLFPARKRIRLTKENGAAVKFIPKATVDSQMSTATFRALTRTALVECCNLTRQQAAKFGTHSFRIGSIEELRKCGVPSELRQQLGGWMSHEVALSYMQLEHGAQFDILEQM